MITEFNFPQYEYTHEIVALMFESGAVEVKYIPQDTRFTIFTFIIPLLPTFDPSNVSEYFKQWAPFDKWYAQEVMIQHKDSFLGS